jgi:hypothetical protein
MSVTNTYGAAPTADEGRLRRLHRIARAGEALACAAILLVVGFGAHVASDGAGRLAYLVRDVPGGVAAPTRPAILAATILSLIAPALFVAASRRGFCSACSPRPGCSSPVCRACWFGLAGWRRPRQSAARSAGRSWCW